ncbi:hypothetical protein Tco_0226254, partial [Tanacetum coccineum]
VAVSSSLRLLEPKRTIESRAKRSSINLVRTQHPSETMVFHNEDGNPARANIKQALGYLKDGDGDGNSQLLRYQCIEVHRVSGSLTGEVGGRDMTVGLDRGGAVALYSCTYIVVKISEFVLRAYKADDDVGELDSLA